MIDIESAELTKVQTAISSLCTNIGSADSTTTTVLPYLQFVQKDNPIYNPTSTYDNKENHVQPMIQIDVYTKDTLYKAKQIMKLADTQMATDGWKRIFGPQPISLQNPFHLVARYQAIVTETSTNNFTVI